MLTLLYTLWALTGVGVFLYMHRNTKHLETIEKVAMSLLGPIMIVIIVLRSYHIRKELRERKQMLNAISSIQQGLCHTDLNKREW